MFEIRQTATFVKWLKGLRDRRAKARIQARIDRMELGNFGDISSAREGVSELRIHYRPGYRVYFMQRGPVVVVLLLGSDKSSQNADITKAKRLAKQLDE